MIYSDRHNNKLQLMMTWNILINDFYNYKIRLRNIRFLYKIVIILKKLLLLNSNFIAKKFVNNKCKLIHFMNSFKNFKNNYFIYRL